LAPSELPAPLLSPHQICKSSVVRESTAQAEPVGMLAPSPLQQTTFQYQGKGQFAVFLNRNLTKVACPAESTLARTVVNFAADLAGMLRPFRSQPAPSASPKARK